MSTQKRCLLKLKKPVCKAAPYSRPNHNGNGKDGLHLRYTWNLPHFPSMTSEDDKRAFIFRIRLVGFLYKLFVKILFENLSLLIKPELQSWT